MSDMKKGLLLGSVLGMCVLLTACQSELAKTPTILDNEANYSVSISLPYATMEARRETGEQHSALEINDDGKVTVNDSQTVMQEEGAELGDRSNYKSLRQGNTGLAVQVLQTRLAELGYYTAGVSGIYDTETEAAVRRFEQTYGTMQTGVATADLQSRLFADGAIHYGTDAYNSAVLAQYRVLQKGDSGSAVYALQQRLRSLGYPIGELTGEFDDATAQAVGLFYQEYGLKYSEIANVALQQEIYSDSARSYTGSITAEKEETGTNENEESADTVGTEVGTVSNFVAVTLNSTLEIQQRLIGLGYMTGDASGEFDAKTEIAVKLFQEACGIEVTGEINDEVVEYLNRTDAPTFEEAFDEAQNLLEGSSGDPVLQMQQRLVDLGFAKGTPNGEYGEATSASVSIFQTINGLEPNGMASAQTIAVLYSSFAKNIEGATPYAGTGTSSHWSGLAGQTAAAEAEAPQPVQSVNALLKGSAGNEVLRLQYRLAELGYACPVTTAFDDATEAAVIAIQANMGVEPNGVVDTYALAFICSDGAPRADTKLYDSTQNYHLLQSGSTGNEVENLQRKLWQLGYLDQNEVTAGLYDHATIDAVNAFETAIGYREPDGVACAELQCYLFSL